ncbi:MAG: peptide chain release factor N(5)-glutamine methyltransferase [Clostridia bacterium]|nr:peptide chain release factor N(5)-glutamine methyltransferase [Clostridia bacterium]
MNVNKAMQIALKKVNDNVTFRTIDAKVLICYVLGISISEFALSRRYLNLTEEQEEEYFEYINQINNGKPLQYITHESFFMNTKLYVDENVLIPQPDTEILVEKAIDIINNKNKKNIKVLDLCTGSGAIAISLKQELKDRVEVFASDISEAALDVAKRNVSNILGEKDSIKFIKSNMFERINEKFDIIVSNPPYIESEEIENLPIDVQSEPHIALDGGKDGLKFYRIIKESISEHLLPEGYLLMEIGYNQKDKMLKLFPGSECIKDYSDNDRLIVYKK